MHVSPRKSVASHASYKTFARAETGRLPDGKLPDIVDRNTNLSLEVVLVGQKLESNEISFDEGQDQDFFAEKGIEKLTELALAPLSAATEQCPMSNAGRASPMSLEPIVVEEEEQTAPDSDEILPFNSIEQVDNIIKKYAMLVEARARQLRGPPTPPPSQLPSLDNIGSKFEEELGSAYREEEPTEGGLFGPLLYIATSVNMSRETVDGEPSTTESAPTTSHRAHIELDELVSISSESIESVISHVSNGPNAETPSLAMSVMIDGADENIVSQPLIPVLQPVSMLSTDGEIVDDKNLEHTHPYGTAETMLSQENGRTPSAKRRKHIADVQWPKSQKYNAPASPSESDDSWEEAGQKVNSTSFTFSQTNRVLDSIVQRNMIITSLQAIIKNRQRKRRKLEDWHQAREQPLQTLPFSRFYHSDGISAIRNRGQNQRSADEGRLYHVG